MNPRTNNHRGSIGLRRLHSLVSARDIEVLRSIESHRYLSTGHVFQLHFWNHASAASGLRACSRVLTRLESHRLIRRVHRQVGGSGGGSGAIVWALDVAGDRLLRDETDSTRSNRRRMFEPSLYFLRHTLAIADLRVELELMARSGLIELLTIQTEPANWRKYVGALGAYLALKPDLYAVTARVGSEYEDHWFIEVDLGTESLPALRRKCEVYLAYYQSGTEQGSTGVFPRVIWLMSSPPRARLLSKYLSAGRTKELFTVITAAGLVDLLTGTPHVEVTPITAIKGRTVSAMQELPGNEFAPEGESS